MKQVIQSYKTGKIRVEEVPVPFCKPGGVLVQNVCSLISIGTERSVIDFGKKGLIGKARAKPDLLKQAWNKAQKEGFWKTYQEVMGRLDSPTALGYSSAGVVIEVGEGVDEFSTGDRVDCIGAGFASHAEVVWVPHNLCVHIPKKVNRVNQFEQITNNSITDNFVSFEEASFGMLGIIALHGVRCAKINLGEKVAVIGLGLIGQLTVQILKAAGCKVIGSDINKNKIKESRADLAVSNEELADTAKEFTNGYGVDAVIITAASETKEPIELAAEICRFGGRVVLVGVIPIEIPRQIFWEKEIEFIVSRAGGPGTFDHFYEAKGIDYPPEYVRWTQRRNLEAFLGLIAEGKINVKALITHRLNIENALKAYDMILNNTEPYIGVILQYPEELHDSRYEIVGSRKNLISNIQNLTSPDVQHLSSDTISVGVIGAGLFANTLFLPALSKIPKIQLKGIAATTGMNVNHTGKKVGFEYCTTHYEDILNDPNINCVFILTRHSLHAKMVIESLKAGKHVFIEKPLCINEEELGDIIDTYTKILDVRYQIKEKEMSDKSQNPISPFLMVGYNRRFSPHTARAIEYFKNCHEPMVINYRINAGFVSSSHWVHSEEEGGSRIIGEVCHFVDMMQSLTKSNPVRVYAERITGNNKTSLNSDNLVIALKFSDGSVGNITYSASGDKAFSREQIEVFCEGRTIVINDFRKTIFHHAGKKKLFKTFNQKMGYKEELKHFFEVIAGNAEPKINTKETFLSTLAVFKINKSLEKGKPISIEARG